MLIISIYLLMVIQPKIISNVRKPSGVFNIKTRIVKFYIHHTHNTTTFVVSCKHYIPLTRDYPEEIIAWGKISR